MVLFKMPLPPLHSLLERGALTPAGPSAEALELFADLGHSHGKRRRRWEPSEQLVSQLARAFVSALNASDADFREEIGRRKAALGTQASGASGIAPTPQTNAADRTPTLDDLHGRRALSDAARRMRQAERVEAEIREIDASLAAREESADVRRIAIVEGAAVLWSAYRVAYVNSFPGPSYGQAHGPRIPKVPTISSREFVVDLTEKPTHSSTEEETSQL